MHMLWHREDQVHSGGGKEFIFLYLVSLTGADTGT